MVTETRRKKPDGLAFTLLEMLLTVALLVALLGAVVYNFGSLRRGSELEEGARQLEALVRFASAHAANSGRAVQLRFGDDVISTTSTNSTPELSATPVNDIEPIDDLENTRGNLRVLFEVDPVAQPGIFIDLREAAPFLEAISDRVRIVKVQLPERPSNLRTNDLTFVQEGPAAAPTVTFYPDGSTDTAEIHLASLDNEDRREMILRVDGVTGAIRVEMKSLDDLVPIEWMDEEGAPQQTKETTSSTTVGESSGPKPVETTPMRDDPAFDDLNKTDRDLVSTNAFDEDFPE